MKIKWITRKNLIKGLGQFATNDVGEQEKRAEEKYQQQGVVCERGVGQGLDNINNNRVILSVFN